jgi:hypothetical protein
MNTSSARQASCVSCRDLTFHKVTHQFFTCIKALRWGHNQYSESALGSTSRRLLLLLTPLVFGPYLPQNIDAPTSTLEPCIIFHLIAKEVATSSTLQSSTKRCLQKEKCVYTKISDNVANVNWHIIAVALLHTVLCRTIRATLKDAFNTPQGHGLGCIHILHIRLVLLLDLGIPKCLWFPQHQESWHKS